MAQVVAGVDTSQVVCFVILAVSLVLALTERLRNDVVAVLTVLALAISGLLTWLDEEISRTLLARVTPGQPRPTSIQIPIATKSSPAARVR